MSDAVKIAKIQANAASTAANRELLRSVMFNPIVELIGGFALVETLQRWPQSRPIIGNVQGNTLEGIICLAIAYQQISPNIPAIAQANNDFFDIMMKPVTALSGAVGQAAPALLALAK